VIDKLNESQERLKEREEVREKKTLGNAARVEAAAARREAIEEERTKKVQEQASKRIEKQEKAHASKADSLKKRGAAISSRGDKMRAVLFFRQKVTLSRMPLDPTHVRFKRTCV
jgi:hypothetical protein